MSIGSEVVLSIDPGEIGWVNFALRVGEASFSYQIGDLTDAVGDLLRAALLVVCDAKSVSFNFDLEPGDLIVRLERGPVSGERVRLWETVDRLRITIIEDRGSRAETLFQADCGYETFGEAVFNEIRALLTRASVQEFQERWDRPFPARAFAALERALETPGD